MAVGCGANCAKWTLFVFNLIFWLTGAAILGVGIYMRVDPSIVRVLQIATVTSSDKLVPGAAIVLICVGLFIFITGFLGCCGAVKENGCMLMTYAAILIFILILQVVAGILAAIFRNKIDQMLASSMDKVVQNQYKQNGFGSITEAWDAMQIEFQCCGANGPLDWKTSAWKNHTANATQTVPDTCCVYNDPGKKDSKIKNEKLCQDEAKAFNSTSDTHQYLNAKGCHPQLYSWLKSKAGILIGVAFGLVFIQVAVIAMACILRKSKQKEYDYV